MLAFFLFCVYVQTNDPDPVGWMLVYGLAALCCGLAIAQKLPAPVPTGLGLVSLVWSLSLAPAAFSSQNAMFADAPAQLSLFDREEGREMFGLLLVAAWSGLLALSLRPAKPR